MWYDDYFRKMYITFHMNMGNYLSGILFGFIYHRKIKFNFTQTRAFKILWYTLPLQIAVAVLHGRIFYENEYPKPALWMAIYYTANKNLLSFFAMVFMLGLLNGVGGNLRVFLSHQVFNILGKLSYSAFLTHTFVIRFFFLNLLAPSRIDANKMVS
jgi:peptidoglycan/LPS O-acetylase OafA/YrhL